MINDEKTKVIIKNKDNILKKKIDILKNNLEAEFSLKEISQESLKIAKHLIRNHNDSEFDSDVKNLKNKIKMFTDENPEFNCKCEICHDTGMHDGKTCKCINSMVDSTNVRYFCHDFDFSQFSFSNFDIDLYPDNLLLDSGLSCRNMMRNAFESYVKYASSFGRLSKNLMLVGGAGLGKTHIAVSISDEVSKTGKSVVYSSAPYIVKELEKNRYVLDPFLEKILFDCDLLVLDNLGIESSFGYFVAYLFDILDYRISKKFPSIVVTQLPISEMEKKYGSGIVSRIIGYFERCPFAGVDIRQLKSEK